MIISKPLNIVLTTILLLIFISTSFGQKLEPIKRITEPDHNLTSDILGRDYQLYISFPSSYSAKDTISYPVLYVLDGMRDFTLFDYPNFYLGLNGETEQVIIVGIRSGTDPKTRDINRTYDLTPKPNIDTIDVIESEKKQDIEAKTIKYGGAAKFLEFIKTEVIPFVDKSYKTNTNKGITGHSYAGLFTAYCLLNSDGFFTRFGINSPSLWWNDDQLLEQAILKFTENKTWDLPPTKVFISVGGKEGKKMAPAMVKFSSYLQHAKYENIDLNWVIFYNETHGSVVPVSLRQTIIELYRK